ncbi:hypothetical protein ABIA32_004052 [Streptacidiphilus sp. MAP12-20]|uniref:hypothetical protein n=1 Tax=Streptacidiphilus sp. MAP12-20 TaxID=3156299 RepID=UPI00351955BC
MAQDAGDEFEAELDEEQLGTPEPWFYCTRHHRVEQGRQCPGRFLLGPYETAEAAEHALERVQEHNEAWDAQDEPRGEGGKP